jgi:hypothetical protein
MNEKLIPNSSQIPHIITDVLIPQLPEGEARCVLYVARRTFGFHKDKDKISLSQFERGIETKEGKTLDLGTGLSRPVIVEALKNLIAADVVISIHSTTGNEYELNLDVDIDSAVQKIAKLRKESREKKEKGPRQTRLFKVVRKTNQLGELTGSSKENLPEVVRRTNTQTKEKKEKKVSQATPTPKQKSVHSQLIELFYDVCKRSRDVKPIITKADAANLKRVLDIGMSQQFLSQLIIYFLGSFRYKQFTPSMSTLLSSGILNGLMNKAKNDHEFWKELDGLMQRYGNGPAEGDSFEMAMKLNELKSKLFNGITARV